MEGYVQINGSFASDLSQDLENLANTIASSCAGDPVMLRSQQTFNGRNGDVIQARKKYDSCVRELDVLRLRAREQDDFHSQNLFEWILHLIEHHISNLPYATQRLKNEYEPYAKENLQILSNHYAESPILRRLAELAFDCLLSPNNSKLSNGSYAKKTRTNKARCITLFDNLAKIKALWMLKWTADHVSADLRWQVFFEFNIWMLNQLNSRVPFTIFEFLMDVDPVAFQQSMIGLLEYYLDIANNYIQDRLSSSLEKYVGERIIVSHLLSLTIQYPELIKNYEKQIWDRLSVKNIQTLCYFECFTRFSLCVSSSNETVPLWDAFSSWLLSWLTNDSPNVIPHVLPVCLLLDSLANEQYVVNDENIDHTELNYLNNVIRTRCTYIIQHITNMIDECVMDFHFNSEAESYLNALIENYFLSQYSTTESEPSEHLIVTPHNFFDLNRVLTMLSYRWGTECEHFWLVMLKCIGLATKQNAIKTIVELLLIMDFSTMSLEDERIVSMINLARELITALELKWKDVVSLAVDKIVEKTLLYKNLDLPSLAINTRHTRVYKTFVYFISTHPDTSNINLTELTSGSLVLNKTCKCIVDALGGSYRKLLRNFRCMLNSHNDRIETTSSGWLLLLLLYVTSHMLKKSSARYIITCCNELIDVWFDVTSRQSQLTNTNGRKVQWDKTIAVLEMIVLTFSQCQEAFLYIPSLLLKKLLVNNESIRNWPCKVQTIPEDTSDSESYIRHKIPRFRFGAPNSNSKSSITAWKTLKPKPWSVKKPSTMSSINSNSWQKNFVMFINNYNTSSPEHDCTISNAWNNGILFRICCMRPDLLSFESSKTSLLIRLLLNRLTTKEPPTNITGHIILPKSITYRRDTFLQSTFSEHPELWILLGFLANDCVMFEELFNSLVRSLFAMNITFWYRVREQTRRKNQIELDTAIRLVEILQKAHYIPSPLKNVGCLLPHLQSKDVGYLLFESIWKFVLENWQLCPYSDDYDMFEEQATPNNHLIHYSERVNTIKLMIQKNILSIPEILPHLAN